MDISVKTFFNIVIITVTYELRSYPIRRVGIFASNDNNNADQFWT